MKISKILLINNVPSLHLNFSIYIRILIIGRVIAQKKRPKEESKRVGCNTMLYLVSKILQLKSKNVVAI